MTVVLNQTEVKPKSSKVHEDFCKGNTTHITLKNWFAHLHFSAFSFLMCLPKYKSAYLCGSFPHLPSLSPCILLHHYTSGYKLPTMRRVPGKGKLHYSAFREPSCNPNSHLPRTCCSRSRVKGGTVTRVFWPVWGCPECRYAVDGVAESNS